MFLDKLRGIERVMADLSIPGLVPEPVIIAQRAPIGGP
jgi:hypothetical protein